MNFDFNASFVTGGKPERPSNIITGLVRGSPRGTGGGLCSRTLWGVEGHYSLELVECLLREFGVDTRSLRLERVVRLSRKGGRLNYVSLVGPAAALDSLDSGQKDVLKQRGWRVGWGDRVAKGNEMGGWGPRGLPTSIHRRFH